MPRISTDNYDTVASWNGSQDLFVVEQPDGTKVATPAMVKQFIEAGNFTATGEVEDGHGNKLSGVVDIIGDLSQTGLTGDSVAEQLTAINEALVLEPFNVTLNSSIGTPQVFDQNNFYNPKTKQVHLNILIYTPNATIPTSGGTVFTVPEKYRPASNTQLGMAIVMDNTDPLVTRAERCWISNAGIFALNNFVYGTRPTRLLSIEADYISR